MFELKSAGKYNSIKERRYKIAVAAVFIFTAFVYITFILLMITTKFRILSPLIKFHDSVVYTYSDSGEVIKEPNYSPEYIKELLQHEFESSPSYILSTFIEPGVLVILWEGLLLLLHRKKGKFIFSNSRLGIKLFGIFSCIYVIVNLFFVLWAIRFSSIRGLFGDIEPSGIYYWLFLMPLLLLNILFVLVYNKASYYEGKYVISKCTQQRSNVKYCKECGMPINNSAVLCDNCSENKPSELVGSDCSPQQPIYNDCYPILYGKERAMIITIGVLYIVIGALGVVSVIGLLLLLNPVVLALLRILIIGTGIGSCIDLISGIGILLKKRWAALTLRVLMIIGIVVNLFTMLIVYESILSVIFLLLNVACDIATIIFTSSIARTLSNDVQNYRTRINGRR